MKNKYLYGAVLLGVLGLFAFMVFTKSGVFFSNTSLTAAVIQSKGVEYPVTAEYPSVSARAASLVSYDSYGQISPSTIASAIALPNVQTQNADLPPPTTSMLGYIVELTEQPLSVKYKELKDAKSLASNTKAILTSQKTKITNQQDIFLTSLSSSIKAKNGVPISYKKTKRFNAVLNAVILNINDAEAEFVRKLPNVKSVQPVQKVRAFLMDSVPLINAPQVWAGTVASTSITGRGIKIAIIDTGVDYTHPDLGGCLGLPAGTTTPCKVAGGYDFINSDANPMDDMGHGTHVAAIAAGNGALKGVAPDATIYAYKVLNQNGFGTWETIIAGLEKTVDPNGDGDLSDHLDLANLSLGGGGNPDDAVSTAVDNLVDAGVVVTVAAGNSGPGPNTIGSPGTARKAITVGATDKYDNMAYFSSRGPVRWNTLSGPKYLVKPDVVAPGVNICAARYDSAFLEGDTNCNNDTNHVAISGTSMATPHVTGEVALLLQLHHDWTPTEIKMVIRKGTVLANPLQYYDESTRGSGRIDAKKTLQLNKLPTAILVAMPVSNRSINITGTATAQNFSSYTLSYGFGQNPSSYTDITFSGQPIMNGVLHANFDTTQLNEGVNTIKLLVTDTSGNTSEDKAFLEVNNLEITSVGNTLNYVNGGIQQIKGFISLPSVINYRVYYYSKAGKVILCSGGSVPKGNVICSADFSSMQNGKHAIYLEVSQNSKLKTDRPFEIAVVKELMDNWPQEIYGFPRGMHSIIGTDNNQLDKQLVFSGYSTCGAGWCKGPPTLSFYKSNGSFTKLLFLLDGSDIPDDYLPSIYYDSAGKKNYLVLTGGSGQTKIAGSDGAVFKTIPNQIEGVTYPPVTVFDRNEDGVPEIYATSFNRDSEQFKAVGYNFQEKELAGFPVLIPKGGGTHSFGSTHVSFLKGNETASTTVYQNMILIAGDHNINNGFVTDLKLYAHVFSKNNQLIQSTLLFDGTNKTIQVSLPFPAVADLNGDGNMEMIIMYGVVDMNLFLQNNYNPDAYITYIQVLDNKGNITSSMSPIKGYMASQIAIGDSKSEENPNIVAVLSDTWPTTSRGNRIIEFDSSLKTVFDKNESDYNSPDALIQGVSIGDVDGDKISDIVLSYRPRWWWGEPSGLQIISNTGFLKRDIKLPTLGAADDFRGSPAILDDFDGDDTVDVILQSMFIPKDVHAGFGNIFTTRLYPLKLSGVFKPAAIGWKTLLHDNAHTGCYGCFATSSVVITEPETQPTVSIIDTLTLKMAYIPPNEENELVSTFRVAINAGSNDQKIAKNYAFSSYVRTNGGIFAYGDTQYAQPSGTTDDGSGFYIIPANTTAIFTVQTTFNPKKMFAGAYYGVLEQVRLGDYFNPRYINIPPPNTTNTLVIVGEVSPYINSVSPNPVSPGSKLTISGVRFGINVVDTVYLYPNFKGGSVRQYQVASSDGLTIRFKLSPESMRGNYFLQIVHPQTGASNMIYLTPGDTLGDSLPEQPSSSGGSGGGGSGGGVIAPPPEPPVIEHVPAPVDVETSFLEQFAASVLNGFNLLFKLK